MDFGTIGSNPCEMRLNEMLMELNDRKITKYVTRNLLEFRQGLRELRLLDGEPHQLILIQLWRDHYIKAIHDKVLPESVKTHMLCCLTAYFRNTINDIRSVA